MGSKSRLDPSPEEREAGRMLRAQHKAERRAEIEEGLGDFMVAVSVFVEEFNKALAPIQIVEGGYEDVATTYPEAIRIERWKRLSIAEGSDEHRLGRMWITDGTTKKFVTVRLRTRGRSEEFKIMRPTGKICRVRRYFNSDAFRTSVVLDPRKAAVNLIDFPLSVRWLSMPTTSIRQWVAFEVEGGFVQRPAMLTAEERRLLESWTPAGFRPR